MSIEKLFRETDLNGRMNLINDKGQLIATREYYNQKINLYALPGFYAELFYSPIQNKITRIEPINNIDGLNKYLHLIDIDLS